MSNSPSPLFKPGTSARVKGIFFSLIAVLLLVVDARLQTLNVVRQVIGSVLYPIQMLVLVPGEMVHHIGDYFLQVSTLEKENAQLKQLQLTQNLELNHTQQLQHENVRLRQLLAASQLLPIKLVMATVLYDARDSFTRRVIVDRGMQHGVVPGQAVIDDKGVMGQITRVFPYTSEVTLLTDKDQAIPVQVQRNGLRGVLYGKGEVGHLEMRLPSDAEIKVGDLLITSGLDDVYPEGLGVARVSLVENSALANFERIVCLPLAGLDRYKEVLILLLDKPIQPPALLPINEKKENNKATDQKINRKVTRDTTMPTTISSTAMTVKKDQVTPP